jgi:hypothetical protein
MKKMPNRTPQAIAPKKPGVPSPPPQLVRPRNGVRTGNALGVDKLSGLSGGGKSPKHFTPIADQGGGSR